MIICKNHPFNGSSGILSFVLLVIPLACQDPDSLPTGPCNEDGDTFGSNDEIGDSDTIPPQWNVKPPSTPIDDFRPSLPSVDGWLRADDLDGFYRYATAEENRRFRWSEHTLVLATPSDFLAEKSSGEIWIVLPSWLADREQWLLGDTDHVQFDRRQLAKIQTLSLGHFVEHRTFSGDANQPVIHRPDFDVFGARDSATGFQTRLITASTGGLLLREMDPDGGLMVSSPHASKTLDLAAPPGFEVTVISPSRQDITRDPLVPYDCENGECEDPDDPLNECIDGIDNDGDGHGDLCDWNCLPHADFGADKFPLASSRVENGKSFAMMGGGSICTNLGDTWTVAFADMALQASALLGDVRPDVNDPVRFRVFSCWVFEDQEALQSCQHGPLEVIEGEPVWSDPICPPGLEDYPYRPTDTELLLPNDRGVLYFDEVTERAWQDLEMNTLALGHYGEPVNGVIFLSSDGTQTCLEGQLCGPVAGVAYMSPNAGIRDLGFAVVTDANSYDWHTLAHEVGHVLGLDHDLTPEGFMNDTHTGGVLPLLGIAENFDNNEAWDKSLKDKGWLPRSSGWSHTDCSGPEECAPLGKPGWSCNILWCVQD